MTATANTTNTVATESDVIVAPIVEQEEVINSGFYQSEKQAPRAVHIQLEAERRRHFVVYLQPYVKGDKTSYSFMEGGTRNFMEPSSVKEFHTQGEWYLVEETKLITKPDTPVSFQFKPVRPVSLRDFKEVAGSDHRDVYDFFAKLYPRNMRKNDAGQLVESFSTFVLGCEGYSAATRVHKANDKNSFSKVDPRLLKPTLSIQVQFESTTVKPTAEQPRKFAGLNQVIPVIISSNGLLVAYSVEQREATFQRRYDAEGFLAIVDSEMASNARYTIRNEDTTKESFIAFVKSSLEEPTEAEPVPVKKAKAPKSKAVKA